VHVRQVALDDDDDYGGFYDHRSYAQRSSGAGADGGVTSLAVNSVKGGASSAGEVAPHRHASPSGSLAGADVAELEAAAATGPCFMSYAVDELEERFRLAAGETPDFLAVDQAMVLVRALRLESFRPSRPRGGALGAPGAQGGALGAGGGALAADGAGGAIGGGTHAARRTGRQSRGSRESRESLELAQVYDEEAIPAEGATWVGSWAAEGQQALRAAFALCDLENDGSGHVDIYQFTEVYGAVQRGEIDLGLPPPVPSKRGGGRSSAGSSSEALVDPSSLQQVQAQAQGSAEAAGTGGGSFLGAGQQPKVAAAPKRALSASPSVGRNSSSGLEGTSGGHSGGGNGGGAPAPLGQGGPMLGAALPPAEAMAAAAAFRAAVRRSERLESASGSTGRGRLDKRAFKALVRTLHNQAVTGMASTTPHAAPSRSGGDGGGGSKGLSPSPRTSIAEISALAASGNVHGAAASSSWPESAGLSTANSAASTPVTSPTLGPAATPHGHSLTPAQAPHQPAPTLAAAASALTPHQQQQQQQQSASARTDGAVAQLVAAGRTLALLASPLDRHLDDAFASGAEVTPTASPYASASPTRPPARTKSGTPRALAQPSPPPRTVATRQGLAKGKHTPHTSIHHARAQETESQSNLFACCMVSS